MNRNWTSFNCVIGAALVAGLMMLPAIAQAQQQESHLNKIVKAQILRVCLMPDYFSISYKNPATGQYEGIDADLAQELGKDLGAKVEYVESSWSTFIADLQTDKCDIVMSGIGATMSRAKAVAFSKPYILAGIYAVARKDSTKVKTWADLDKPDVTIAVSLGGYIEPFLKTYLKNAKIMTITPPAIREQEVALGRADAMVIDYPTAIKVTSVFDWPNVIEPPTPTAVASFSYPVQQGDQIWLNYVNQFVDTIKRDGRLMTYAKKYKLDPVVSTQRD